MDEFLFQVVPWRGTPRVAEKKVYLERNNWNDFSFVTTFNVIAFDEGGQRYQLGDVKIGQRGLVRFSVNPEGIRSPQLPQAFDSLDDEFFSLGQEQNYYEMLYGLSATLAEQILDGLNDCANDLSLLNAFLGEPVMQESLLRFVTPPQVRLQFHRSLRGEPSLTPYRFNYTVPCFDTANDGNKTLHFNVMPESFPPTNIQVLIGSNGTGKTMSIKGMAQALVAGEGDLEPQDDIIFPKDGDGNFSRVVLVSFSAFDDIQIDYDQNRSRMLFSQVGLRATDNEGNSRSKSTAELADDFFNSLVGCLQEPRRSRWIAAIRELENDSLFAGAEVLSLLNIERPEQFHISARELFMTLSSGHSILLLTMTRLVELVDDRTLVLLDEPEGHLHPPLLSAFMRSLSDLLIKRNAVAVMATHSSVVLQEVPKSCALVLYRSGNVLSVERPRFETFGENTGALTQMVFGLEITRTGFHQMLSDAVSRGLSYEQVMEHFSNALGSEARAIVRCLIATRDRQRGGGNETP
jgi:ABC-type cobalamin/Fe3+-siderophores transport system ATPase subunit